MKNFALLRGRTKICLILLCLILVQACRKDRGILSETEFHSDQLIQQTVLKKWFETNKNSKLLKLNWAKAQQGVLNGKNVVRIPTISPENSSTVISTAKLKNGSLSSNGLSAGIGNTNALSDNSESSNYNPSHPPELFFIQDGPNGKLHSYLLNFVPKDRNKENGDNGVWTGKLLEWNVQGDTVLVQELEQSKVKSYYAIKPGAPAPPNLSNVVKNNKLQSINLPSIKDKQVSGFFGWLIDKLVEFAGWVGSFFGLSVHNTFAYDRYNDSFNTEYQLHINFDWLTGGGGGPPADPGTTTPPTPVDAPIFVVYIGAGEPVYQSYASGYIGNTTGGGGLGTGSGPNTGGPDIYHPYPVWNGESIDGSSSGGPNFTSYNLSAQYLINQGWVIGGDNIEYINSHKTVADAFVSYIDKIDYPTQSDIDFLNWAIGFVRTNPQGFDQDFRDFLSSSDSEIIETEDFNSTLTLNISSTSTPNFSTNGFGVFTTNGSQTDTYPETHPVSVAIANYNEWIYRALVGANNTSVKHLHLNSKGLAGSDSYAKGIGAIGEGIFAQRVTTEYPTSPGGNMYIGYYINTTHIDALQEHYLPGAGGSYYGLQVNYTDINGNPLSKKFEYPDPSHSTTLEKGRIAYEIKTNNVNRNSAATLYQTFLMGIRQTVHRANIRGIDAGVLVMDYDAWKKLLNSSYNQQVIAKLNEVYNIKNDKNEQKIFLRIEKNLWSDANKAYRDILGRIKNL